MEIVGVEMLKRDQRQLWPLVCWAAFRKFISSVEVSRALSGSQMVVSLTPVRCEG